MVIPKYSYDPIVEEYSNILVLAVGRKVGGNTRCAAIKASAEAANKSVIVQEVRIQYEDLDNWLDTFAKGGIEVIVLVTLDNVDLHIGISRLSQMTGVPVLSYSMAMTPSYSPEYEEILGQLNELMIDVIGELLPKTSPHKDKFMGLAAKLKPIAIKKPRPVDD